MMKAAAPSMTELGSLIWSRNMHVTTYNKYNNLTDHWNIVSVISRCASRALSENSERYDVLHCSVIEHGMMPFELRFVLLYGSLKTQWRHTVLCN